MPTLTKSARKALPLSLILCFFILCLVINPQRYIESIFSGMLLFAKNVAPALFPFFFFTKLLTGLGMANSLGRALKRPISRLYNAPGESGYILVMSLISGYPIGAKLISDFYENGIFSVKNCKKVSSFTSTSGPLFVVGTVGTLMFSSPKAGYVLFLCHALGALINGLLYRGRKSVSEISAMPASAKDDKLLNNSITSSILSVLIVGGYIAIFSMIIDIAIDIKLVDAIAFLLEKPLSWFSIPSEVASATVISMIEITRGCQAFAQSGIDIKIILPFVAGLLSFGGLSITFQSLTFLKNCKIKTPYYFLTKLTQAIITFLISLVLVRLFY
ncbi:MAG: hypothetical protein K2O95_04320 [Clostridia bacterium]|nr:hypothetical protein [Clostridia bacterium]MDE7079323.1 hypothetical protein [Clostridia bacterium]